MAILSLAVGSLDRTGHSHAQPLPSTVSAASPTPTLLPGECRGWPDKVASRKVYLGDTADVTLTFRAECRGTVERLHIVLVLDASAAMAGDPGRQMKSAASALVDRLQLPKYPETRVGVVAVNDAARTLAPVTNDEARVKIGIERLRFWGEAKVHLGLDEGMRALQRARGRPTGRVYTSEVIVFMSGGHDVDGCSPLLHSASAVKAQGALLITVCVGSDCDAACMRQAASSARYFYRVEDVEALLGLFERIRRVISNIVLKRLTVTDTLPVNMEYVALSADPRPKVVGAGGRLIAWETLLVPASGVTYSLRVRPLEIGEHPTNVEAVAAWVSNIGEPGHNVFPVPRIEVLPRPTATPSATSTVTPRSTPTLEPSRTPTSTSTPSRLPAAIYLPAVAADVTGTPRSRSSSIRDSASRTA